MQMIPFLKKSPAGTLFLLRFAEKVCICLAGLYSGAHSLTSFVFSFSSAGPSIFVFSDLPEGLPFQQQEPLLRKYKRDWEQIFNFSGTKAGWRCFCFLPGKSPRWGRLKEVVVLLFFMAAKHTKACCLFLCKACKIENERTTISHERRTLKDP